MLRRNWLSAMFAGLVSAPLTASPSTTEALASEDLTLPSGGKFVRRARLLVDPGTPPERLLILLHGRGEADSTALGLKAWSHLYGLLDAYARLQRPPVVAVLKQPRWEDERAAVINAGLSERSFRGFAIVCPVTPNPAAYGNRAALYRDYAQWLATDLVQAVRERVPTITDRIGLDGCSMGGALAHELLLQRPDAFRSFGTVQGAIGIERADALAARFAASNAKQTLPRIHLLTSSGDPYRQANALLSQRLKDAKIDNTLETIEGPHNQLWLRQMGTLAMLYWHDRTL